VHYARGLRVYDAAYGIWQIYFYIYVYVPTMVYAARRYVYTYMYTRSTQTLDTRYREYTRVQYAVCAYAQVQVRSYVFHISPGL
jgi:hypothetical protein